MGVVATAAIKINADIRDLKKGLSESEKMVQQFGGMVKRAAGLIGGAWLGREFIRNSIEAQSAVAQLNAVVKSTGGVAGFATPQLTAMAGELQRVSTFSDEAIMGAQGLLLTFTKIRGDVLPEATKAVMNMATAMGTDLKSASIQVGKALNDPKVGLTALTRSGVSFSEAQKAVIKNLVDTGRGVEAQKIILAELEVQFGGSAAAARDTLGGALTALKNNFGELFEVSRESSTGVVGAINTITDALPGIRNMFAAFFGGIEMMLVDAAIAWQMNFVKMREFAGNVFAAIAGVMQRSYIPAIRDAGAALEAHAHGLQDSAGMTRSALEAWRTEQYNLIAGLNATVAPVQTVKTKVDELTGSTNAATAAAKKLAATMKEIGGLDFGGALRRQEAKRQEVIEGLSFGAFGVKQMTSGEQAQDAARVTAERAAEDNFNAFAAVPQEFRKGQKATVAELDTLGTRLKAGLGDIGSDLVRGLASVATAMLIGGGGRGSQIGGGLGGAIGGGLGAILGGSFGGPLGGSVGKVLGGAVGSVLGTLGGSLIGGLFDKKTKKVTNGLGAMATQLDRVNQALRNTPSGYKVRAGELGATDVGDNPFAPRPGKPPAGGDPPSRTPGAAYNIANLTVVSNDPDDMLRKVEIGARKKANRGGPSALGFAIAR